MFVQPLQVQMTLDEFRHALRRGRRRTATNATPQLWNTKAQELDEDGLAILPMEAHNNPINATRSLLPAIDSQHQPHVTQTDESSSDFVVYYSRQVRVIGHPSQREMSY